MGRKLWLTTHLWIGIVLGPWFAMVGLTGSAVTYFYELDAALNPQLYRVEPGAPQVTFTRVIELAQRAYPDAGAATDFKLPDAGPVAFVSLRGEGGGEPLSVAVDRVSGHVNGARPLDSSFVAICLKLHGSLLLGPIGAVITDMLGFIGIVSLITGLIVWWPRGGRWRPAFTIRWARTPWVPRIYDLHRVIGVVVLLPLLLLFVSGERNLKMDLNLPSSRAPSAVTCNRGDPAAGPIDVDRAVAIALACSPGGEIISVALAAAGGSKPYTIRLRAPEDFGIQFFGRDMLRIDTSGQVLAEERIYSGTPLDRLVDAFEPIHSGDILGEAGRVLVFLSGLAPLLFYVSGFWLWLYRRHMKRSRARQPAPRINPARAMP